MTPHIKLTRLCKRYDIGQTILSALEDIDLCVERGEFVSLIGPSGCGKSTLLRIVAGLLRPSSGAAHIGGSIVTRPHPEIGIVFQSSLLLPWRTVRANIALQLEMRDMRPSNYTSRMDWLIRLAGLSGFEDRLPHELSGGMQQRVALCRALVHQPSILLLDEPFGSLDAITRDQLNEELQQLWMDEGGTVLMVTHNISEAVYLSDRIVVMTARPGKIAAEIPVSFDRPRSLDMIATTSSQEIVVRVRRCLTRPLRPSQSAEFV